VRNLISEIGELVRRAAGETIAVDIAVEPGLWPAHLDPAQFEAAILNLAINARDAMPSGGRLDIRASNAALVGPEAARLDLAGGDDVAVSVSDTGHRMPPEVKARAFEPFFTTKDVGQGNQPRARTNLRLRQTIGRYGDDR
jgi:signal transduction histidine kinase